MEDGKKKNILLTGATGFLGSHLLQAFLDKSWEVSIIKRSFSNTNRIDNLLHRVSFLDIDIEPLE
jgi:nucleoside-diphosphate-sugar epimerase